MDNKDKSVYASNIDIKEVQRQLAQTPNDPNIRMTCWCFSFCKKCNDFAAQCNCPEQPWNFPFEKQQEWLKTH